MRILFLLAYLLVSSQVADANEPTLRRIEPSPQNGRSAAVVIENASLLHTSQLFPSAKVGPSVTRQFQNLCEQLESILARRKLARDRIVKLDIYLRDESDRDAVEQQLAEWCGEDGLPAVAFVQTKLPEEHQLVALDAVIATIDSATDPPEDERGVVRTLPPGDVVYVSGQAEPGDLTQATRATLESLLTTIGHLKLDRTDVVALKCFLTPMSEVKTVQQEIARAFPNAEPPVVSYVEWIAGETRPIEIELIAAAPHVPSHSAVTYFTPPELKASPVFSRVARIHGSTRIYLSGFEATDSGSGAEQVRSVFAQIEPTLSAAGSDLRHLAKATYYVSDEDVSARLNEIRPTLYDPERPPAASKAMVTGVGHPLRSLSIDLIAARKSARD